MVVLATFTQPTGNIRHRQNNTTVYVNDNNIGKGTLFIAESCLSWVSDSGNGFSIEYPHISLHAISRDVSSFPQECLFLMLDTSLGDEEANGNGDTEEDNEEDEQETTELRLVPDDRGMLDAMFHAMNACQALHPDPEDSVSDEEDLYGDSDDDILMEEPDVGCNQMANLTIENMGRGTSGRVGADMAVGTAVGRGVGMGALEAGMQAGVVDRAVVDRVAVDMGELGASAEGEVRSSNNGWGKLEAGVFQARGSGTCHIYSGRVEPGPAEGRVASGRVANRAGISVVRAEEEVAVAAEAEGMEVEAAGDMREEAVEDKGADKEGAGKEEVAEDMVEDI